MSFSKVVLGLATLALAFSSSTQGEVSHDNGAPDQVSGTNMSEQLVAENFTLAADANVILIRFWAIQSAAPDYRGDVYWAIYSDAANQPGTVVAGGVEPVVNAVVTGNSTLFGYAEYSFDIPVDIQLAPGNYWLALHNGAVSNNGESEMLWSTTAVPVGSNALYFDAVSGWVSSGNELAFRIEDTTIFVDGFESGNTTGWSATIG